jgi:hypothetical protein
VDDLERGEGMTKIVCHECGKTAGFHLCQKCRCKHAGFWKAQGKKEMLDELERLIITAREDKINSSYELDYIKDEWIAAKRKEAQKQEARKE